MPVCPCASALSPALPARSGQLLNTLEGHGGNVWSVAISKDGTFIVSGSSDRTVRVWNRETGVLGGAHTRGGRGVLLGGGGVDGLGRGGGGLACLPMNIA